MSQYLRIESRTRVMLQKLLCSDIHGVRFNLKQSGGVNWIRQFIFPLAFLFPIKFKTSHQILKRFDVVHRMYTSVFNTGKYHQMQAGLQEKYRRQKKHIVFYLAESTVII